ncbi:MAG TPA: hypothetical protein VGQ41_15740 [Pyrinomonadaceae bacterium]|jgi:hypothetical protein|nr:hypothetical protein [Pyrinomonadaceae bacterium]
MNIIELFLFLMAAGLSLVFANLFFRYIGWWGILPAILLGFGSFWLLIEGLGRVIPGKKPNDEKETNQSSSFDS